MRWLDGVTDTMDMGLGGLRELLMDRKAHTVCVSAQKEFSNRQSVRQEIDLFI